MFLYFSGTVSGVKQPETLLCACTSLPEISCQSNSVGGAVTPFLFFFSLLEILLMRAEFLQIGTLSLYLFIRGVVTLAVFLHPFVSYISLLSHLHGNTHTHCVCVCGINGSSTPVCECEGVATFVMSCVGVV